MSVSESDKILIALVVRDVDAQLGRDYALETMDYLGWKRNYGE
jgi:hypothetical protein